MIKLHGNTQNSNALRTKKCKTFRFGQDLWL